MSFPSPYPSPRERGEGSSGAQEPVPLIDTHDPAGWVAIDALIGAHHVRARDVFEQYRGRRLDELLLTTNHVIAETMGVSRPGS